MSKEPNYQGLTDVQLHRKCGTNSSKWSNAFIQINASDRARGVEVLELAQNLFAPDRKDGAFSRCIGRAVTHRATCSNRYL